MVNINTVYQRVLTIANKEQRGYITPAEFNVLANQAQMDIFEQYFYDLNQFDRIGSINETIYSDTVDILQEKIDHFEKFRSDVTMASGGVGTLPDYYRMGALYHLSDGKYCEIESISQNQLHLYINSPLTAPTTKRPIYVRTSGNTETLRERSIQVYPTTITSAVTCNYIAKPAVVRWGYTIVNDKALYNASSSYTTHFELHESEETDLVIKILALSGITIKDQLVASYGAQEDAKNTQQEKQ
jgi:hypothetical protein